MTGPIYISGDRSFFGKLGQLNWSLIFLITLLACLGFACLYSASGGNVEPWAGRQALRFVFCFIIMLVLAVMDLRWWYRLAWPAYFIGLGLLVFVELMGRIGMGAQRWIDLGFMQLQPSELMKIAVIMVLARYYHGTAAEDARRLSTLILPAIIVLVPTGLVLLQPNLGTAIMTVLGGATMVFLAGAPLWLFVLGIGAGAAAVPVVWMFLHDYQKRRVETFLNPENDPLGAGYNIIQSKIAIGSGGISGKGFVEGTQSRLNFLPEKHTDFIFTLWAEEWGFIGGLFLLSLFALIFIYGTWIGLRCRNSFGRFLALGLTFNFSLYVFINIAMVMGSIPVVGIPLPLISYGGSVMLAVMIAFGLIMSCSLYSDSRLSRF